MTSLERYILDQFEALPPLPEGWMYDWEFEQKIEDGELKVVVTGTAVKGPKLLDYEKIKYALR